MAKRYGEAMLGNGLRRTNAANRSYESYRWAFNEEDEARSRSRGQKAKAKKQKSDKAYLEFCRKQKEVDKRTKT